MEQNKKTIKQRLEERWGIQGWVQICLILLVFAITGSSSMLIGRFIMKAIGITPETNPWLRWPVRILSVFFVYQILLVWIGFIFGQFEFFWNFEKKMWQRMLSPFKKKV